MEPLPRFGSRGNGRNRELDLDRLGDGARRWGWRRGLNRRIHPRYGRNCRGGRRSGFSRGGCGGRWRRGDCFGGGYGLKCRVQCRQEGAFYCSIIPKAHFALGWVHIDIHLTRRKRQKEYCRWADIPLPTRICLAQGIGDGRRGRGASVYKDVLVAPRGKRTIRLLNEARDTENILGIWSLHGQKGF